MSINSYFKKYKKNNFLKNFFTLFTGSVIGQSLVLLSLPILTRLFSEEAFGIYVLYGSTVFLLKTLATFCYELSIILPKRDKDAINLFGFSLLIVFLFSSLLFVLIVFFQDNIVGILKVQRISYFIYFVPLSVFLLGNITVLDYWNNRTNFFIYLSIGTVSKSATMSSVQLLTGFSTLKSMGLIPGMILGQFVNFIVVAKLAFNRLKQDAKHLSIKRMLFLAFRYRDIPIFNTILTFTNTLSNELPVLLITRYFGLGYAGVYGLAIKVAKTPSGIVGQSISQVFFNEASKTYNSGGNLFLLIKKTYKNLFILALTIFIPLFIISYFLDFLFGENWNSAGVYVRILIPWLFVMFLNSPVSTLITILNKQKTILGYNILLLISRFFALYLGYTIYNDILISLFLFSVVGVFFNLIILIYFFKIAKDTISQNSQKYK